MIEILSITLRTLYYESGSAFLGLGSRGGDLGLSGLGVSIAFRTLNYGNYGIFLFMGNAGFISSTVRLMSTRSFGML